MQNHIVAGLIAGTVSTVTLLCATSLVQAASPAPSQTVTIGNQTKNTVGTIVDINQGDISCYLKLRDDAGKLFEESVSFDLCHNKLNGQRVRLTYAMSNVQARSCQGDPSCKKTDRIALVTAATVIGKAQTTITAAKQTSHCTATETVIFSCQTGVKLVSVCASRNLTPATGYLQYRFGTAGQPLELMLPTGEIHPRKAAYGVNVAYAGGGAAWLRFSRGSHAYVVYSGIGRWGPNGATMEKRGLAVENNGKLIANLKCTGKSISELGPHWFTKAGYAPNDKEEFFLPD